MSNKNYYLHINSGSLAHYFVDGCIKPSMLIKNRGRDFQDNCSNKIILSNKKWNINEDCSVEILLNSEELKLLDESGESYFLYNSIIPVSRIKSVFITNQEVADDITWKINSTAAFIPQRIIKVEDRLYTDTSKKTSEFCNKQDSIEKLTIKLKQFDRLMGGIAFMRTSLVQIEDEKINSSKNFLDTISYFNESIKNELFNSGFKITKTFHNIFTRQAPVTKFLNHRIDKSTVEKAAKEENLNIVDKFGVFVLENLPTDSLTYKLAVLNTYGKEASIGIEGLVDNLLPKLKLQSSEEIALIFGLSNGYNTIRNYYKFGKRKVISKFELKSKIDYMIIESLFQYVFVDKKVNDKFEWLESLFPKPITISDSYKYEAYNLFDNTILISKKDYSYLLNEILENVSNEVYSWFPKNIISVNKDLVAEKLKTIVKPQITKLVEEVQKDISKNLTKRKPESTISEKDINENLNTELTVIPLGKVNKQSSKILKEKLEATPNVVEPDLFNIDINKQSDDAELKPLLNASELDGLTIRKLKKYSEERGEKIPSNITKKKDIISFILSKN